MEEQFQLGKPDTSGPNFKEIVAKYVRFLPLFLVSVVLSLLIAYIYLRYATPIYSTTGVMVIQQEENMQAGGDEKFQQLFSSSRAKNIQSEIEYLRSRKLMERVVLSLQLNTTYYSVGNIKELNIYKTSPFKLEALKIKDSSVAFSLNIVFTNPGNFQINKGPRLHSFGQVFENAYGTFRLVRIEGIPLNKEYRVTWEPSSSVAYGFISKLIIAPKSQGTGILTLSLQSTNPFLAADVVNQLMAEYQAATIEDKNVTTNQTLVFIDDRLRKITHELDSVTNVFLNYQKENNLFNFEAQSESFFSRIEESNKLMNEQRLQLEVADMLDAYLRNRRNNFSTTPSTLGLNDGTLAALIASYNVAQLERKAMIDGNVPAANPKVQQAEDQIEKLRQSILENLRNIRANINNSINDLESKYISTQAQIRSLPAKQQNLIDIQRQRESKQAVYDFLQEKREESAISLAATISDTKVLEQAGPNLAPVKPDSRNVRMMAVLIGLALPALFIFILEILNDKVNSRSELQKLTSTTILGEVGHSYKNDTLIVTPNNRGFVAEQFRIIRSNLQYVLHNIQKPVILVTSSFSGEGKSFISTNIGGVMALAGRKTIVLEFDIRKPKILSQLNIPKKPGLTNFLLGKAELKDLPIPVGDMNNLFVLACGPVPPNPAEILLDEKINDLFAFLHQNFDVIIMDTAPVGMVSDAMTLSKYANCTLFIVRQGYTYKKQIGLVDELNSQNKLPKVSLILNDVKMRTGYGNYGYGRYGYGYGSGYFDDDETQTPGLLPKWFAWLDTKKWQKKKKKQHSR
jgi:tyrosine-protein kinase Etk/Wzc